MADEQRTTVQKVVAPQNQKELVATIRSRAAQILDNLSLGETFDWVDHVSVELTTQMLATLFDFPFEDRSKLARRSDIVCARPGEGIINSHEQPQEKLMECLAYFSRLRKECESNPVGHDSISMMISGEATRILSPQGHHSQFNIRRRTDSESTPPGISKTARQSSLLPISGVRDHSLDDALGTNATYVDQLL